MINIICVDDKFINLDNVTHISDVHLHQGRSPVEGEFTNVPGFAVTFTFVGNDSLSLFSTEKSAAIDVYNKVRTEIAYLNKPAKENARG